MGDKRRPEDKLEESLSAEGAAGMDASQLDDTGELPALRAVAGELRILRAAIPASQGDAAFAAMNNELETARMNDKQGGLMDAMIGWWKRPVLRTGAAVAAAVLVLGGASLGAAAATGNEPVRNLLGISTTSTIKVEFTGTVVSVNGPVIEVSANGDIRTVIIEANTDLRRGDDDGALPLDGIVAGQMVEVHGRLQADNSIVATRFHLADDDDGVNGTATAGATQAVPTTGATTVPPTAEATNPAPTAPATQPTVDNDDDEDDNRGHGNDDDGDDEDNPGQGGGNGPDRDDDDDDDNNSGHGNDDDGDDEDNSGSGGGGGDDDDDDNGGSGSSDDDDDD